MTGNKQSGRTSIKGTNAKPEQYRKQSFDFSFKNAVFDYWQTRTGFSAKTVNLIIF